MNIFSYLFQPDKSKLSPAGRAFIAWLEIVLISVPATGAVAGLEYLNGHPGDWNGLVQFIVSAMIIALLKAFTTLGVSMKNTSVTLPDAVPVVPAAPEQQPPVVIHNIMPAMPLPEPRIIQVPAPAPPPVPQFKSPLPAPTAATLAAGIANAFSTADINTNVMPAITPMANGRDWTGLELPVVQP